MMDGYEQLLFATLKLGEEVPDLELAETIRNHLKTQFRLKEIDAEIASIPNPFHSEGWITSIPDLDSKRNFKITDFKRINKLRREYSKLKEREEQNIRFLKLKQIDGVIDQLEELNKKSDGTE